MARKTFWVCKNDFGYTLQHAPTTYYV